MESRATMKYVRVSPRKVRRVTKLLTGTKAGDAMIKLGFMPHKGGRLLSQVLKSAIANAEQIKVADPESMVISSVYVDQGPTMKRMRPRAMGRADVIRRRTSHITVILAE